MNTNIFTYFRDNVLSAVIDIITSNFDYKTSYAANSKADSEINSEVSSEIYKNITVEFPKNKNHGDLSTNAAMVLASKFKITPRDLAEMMAVKIKSIKYIESVNVIAPGFINFNIDVSFWHIFIKKVLEANYQYGDNNIGNNELINVEFASPNPTGPMHIGHARGAIYGDTLIRVLKKSNYNVIGEYYINDAGNQIDTLAESLFIRYQQALGKNVQLKDESYPGEYLIDLAQKLVIEYSDALLKEYEVDSKQCHEKIRKIAIEEMMKLIKIDLAALGIKHDVFTSEQKDVIDANKLNDALKILEKKDLVYYGIPEKPKASVDDWEPSKQLLFRSTNFGDDVDRSIKRADGSNTYFGSDIAYHMYKIERGFNHMILLLGADHSGHIKRMEAAINALSDNKAKIKILINQMVNLLRDREVIKMSKRSGNYITTMEIIKEIGKNALRFAMLLRKNDTMFDLDLTKILEQSKDNPVFYVHYAHTRCVSVINKAIEAGVIDKDEISIIDIDNINNIDCEIDGVCNDKILYKYNPKVDILFEKLTDKVEIKIIKDIALFPKIIESAAVNYEPHRITYYLYDLANSLHSLWTRGLEDENLRFILPNTKNDVNEREISRARVVLLYITASIIGNGLNVLGIKPMLRM